MTDTFTDTWLALPEVAAALEAHWQTVQRLVSRGDLPAEKVGGRWFVSRDTVEAFRDHWDRERGRYALERWRAYLKAQQQTVSRSPALEEVARAVDAADVALTRQWLRERHEYPEHVWKLLQTAGEYVAVAKEAVKLALEG